MLSRKIAMALAACALVGACTGSTGSGSTGAGPTSQPGAEGSPSGAPEAVFLLGHPDATAAAIPRLTGFETRINATPGDGDVVLFTVSALDGPMPQTREQIEALRGKSYGPSAILLVRTDENPDAEILELVVLETRELLERNEQPHAQDMPVIHAEDPNLSLLLRGLLARR